MKLKVSTFGIWLFNYGIKTLQTQNKVVNYKSVIFDTQKEGLFCIMKEGLMGEELSPKPKLTLL